MFIFMQKIIFIPQLIFEMLQKYCKLVILGTLGTPGHAHQSNSTNLYQTLILIYKQKITVNPHVFNRYLKNPAT